MPKSDMKIYSTPQGGDKKTTTTISNINPEASLDKLKLLAQSFNALTTNSYDSADKITTLNIDTEEEPPKTLEVTITKKDNDEIIVSRPGTGAVAGFFHYGDKTESDASYLNPSQGTTPTTPGNVTLYVADNTETGTIYVFVQATQSQPSGQATYEWTP